MNVHTFGLYSAFLAWRAIVLRSKRQSRLTVATMFLEKHAIKPREIKRDNGTILTAK